MSRPRHKNTPQSAWPYLPESDTPANQLVKQHNGSLPPSVLPDGCHRGAIGANGIAGATKFYSMLLTVASILDPLSALIEDDTPLGRMRYLRHMAKTKRRVEKEMAAEKAARAVMKYPRSMNRSRVSAIKNKRRHEVRVMDGDRPVYVPEWMIVANCSRCRCLLRNATQVWPEVPRMRHRVLAVLKAIPMIACHVDDRPVCFKCISGGRHNGKAESAATNGDGHGNQQPGGQAARPKVRKDPANNNPRLAHEQAREQVDPLRRILVPVKKRGRPVHGSQVPPDGRRDQRPPTAG